MEKIDLNEYLASNEYPGRGIAVAKAPDGRQVFIGYFIMGRSENSRNRVFDPVPERGGICTMAADPAKLEDPSLIIYNPVLTLGKTHIVTNGDQTDTIFDEMSRGRSFADALRTRTFEPDEPNYTPRISAVVYEDGSYQMSILKSADGNGESVQRYFFDYPQPVAGEGHFISTYKHNGSPIPSFEGEPLRFACPRTIGDFAHGLWQNLNPDNKVSLFARVIDLETGESGDMIFNKYDAVCSDLDDPEEPELLPEELELLKKAKNKETLQAEYDKLEKELNKLIEDATKSPDDEKDVKDLTHIAIGGMKLGTGSGNDKDNAIYYYRTTDSDGSFALSQADLMGIFSSLGKTDGTLYLVFVTRAGNKQGGAVMGNEGYILTAVTEDVPSGGETGGGEASGGSQDPQQPPAVGEGGGTTAKSWYL